MEWLSLSFYHALAMLWMTFWALVLGFGISAALQVLVSKEQMTRAFGRPGLREMLLATGLGAASSSCSFAAVAAGRSAVQQGASLIVALAFMFASTNLVVELGVVLWVLMGWQFVLAEVLGALILIATMWLFASKMFPPDLEEQARIRAQGSGEISGHCCGHDGHGSSKQAGALPQLASAFINDWRMIWKELVIGFLVAGFLAAVIPPSWWKQLFVESGPAWLRVTENAAVGPIIAMLSWVCSCANIPLATLLWAHGSSFGGVIAFIYGDLIVVPIILIYRKYFGPRAAIYITLVLYVSMVVAGIVVDLIFTALKIVPTGARPPSAVEHAMVIWNYTSWLDLAALIVFVWFLFLHLATGRQSGIPDKIS